MLIVEFDVSERVAVRRTDRTVADGTAELTDLEPA
jgi:hypothetical protein